MRLYCVRYSKDGHRDWALVLAPTEAEAVLNIKKLANENQWSVSDISVADRKCSGGVFYTSSYTLFE